MSPHDVVQITESAKLRQKEKKKKTQEKKQAKQSR
jgi:hypothetical protein